MIRPHFGVLSAVSYAGQTRVNLYFYLSDGNVNEGELDGKIETPQSRLIAKS